MTVQEFINQIQRKLTEKGMSAENTQIFVKIPGRNDGYSAGAFDLHPSSDAQGARMIIKPRVPEQSATYPE